MVPTVLEGEIGGRNPTLTATPDNITYVRSGAGFHCGIKGVAGNGGGGWYFPTPKISESVGEKGGSNRVRTNTEDLIDIFPRSLEGVTVMYGGKGRCLIMVYEHQYGNCSNIEKRRLVLGPDPARYSSHLSS